MEEPSLPSSNIKEDKDWGEGFKKYWWLIVVAFLVFFVIKSEPRSQDKLNDIRCSNATPVVNEEDTINKAINKTITTVRKNHSLVGWRRALLVGLICAFPILFYIYSRFPTAIEYTVASFTIAIIVYIFTVVSEYYWWRPKDNLIEKELLKLRT